MRHTLKLMNEPLMEGQPIQPIAENLWWVIPGKLAGVRKPTAEEIATLTCFSTPETSDCLKPASPGVLRC